MYPKQNITSSSSSPLQITLIHAYFRNNYNTVKARPTLRTTASKGGNLTVGMLTI